MWHVNYQYLVGLLKLAKNKYKIFTNRMLTTHPPHQLVLKFQYKIFNKVPSKLMVITQVNYDNNVVTKFVNYSSKFC